MARVNNEGTSIYLLIGYSRSPVDDEFEKRMDVNVECVAVYAGFPQEFVMPTLHLPSFFPNPPSGGSKGGVQGTRAPPGGQNFFIFMQFSAKIYKIIGWRPPPRELAPPPRGNPRSATASFPCSMKLKEKLVCKPRV